MTGTSPRRNADSVRPEHAARLAKPATGPQCPHRSGDGLVTSGERASRRCGGTGRFRGDHNSRQGFSLSGQHYRPEPRCHYSFDQSLADASTWRSGYHAGIARRASGIVSAGSHRPIFPPPIRPGPKPVRLRLIAVCDGSAGNDLSKIKTFGKFACLVSSRDYMRREI